MDCITLSPKYNLQDNMLTHTYIKKILKMLPKHINRYTQRMYIYLSNNTPTHIVLEIQDNLKADHQRYKWPRITVRVENVPWTEINTGYKLRRQIIVHDRNTNITTVHKEELGRREYDVNYDYKPPSELVFPPDDIPSTDIAA